MGRKFLRKFLSQLSQYLRTISTNSIFTIAVAVKPSYGELDETALCEAHHDPTYPNSLGKIFLPSIRARHFDAHSLAMISPGTNGIRIALLHITFVLPYADNIRATTSPESPHFCQSLLQKSLINICATSLNSIVSLRSHESYCDNVDTRDQHHYHTH